MIVEHGTPEFKSEWFDFIKEDQCFHDYGYSRPGKFSDTDLSRDIAAIHSLRGG